MKQALILLLFFSSFLNCNCQRDLLGMMRAGTTTLRLKLDDTAGTLKLSAGPSGEFDDAQVVEAEFLQEGDSVRIYFTGSSNVGGSSSKNNIGLATAADIENTWLRRPYQLIGMGAGGAPSTRRAHSPWVGKLAGTYYCYATNGYGGGYTGEDRNVYLYTSTDGLSWTDGGLAIDKTSFAGISGFGNTCIVTDKFNTPVTIAGKYVMLLEAWTGSIWEIHRAEATSIAGPWTITQKLTSLKVTPSGMYGGACAILNGGKIHVFYHYGLTTTEPTNIAYAQSTDGTNYTIKETGFLTYYDADPTPPTPPAAADSPFPNTTQVGDPFVGELNGKVYIIAEFVQNTPTLVAQLRLWRFQGTFEQFVSGYQ